MAADEHIRSLRETFKNTLKPHELGKGYVTDEMIMEIAGCVLANINSVADTTGTLPGYVMALASCWGLLIANDVTPERLPEHMEAFVRMALLSAEWMGKYRANEAELLEHLRVVIGSVLQSNAEPAPPAH